MNTLLSKFASYFPEISELYDYQTTVLDILLTGENTLAIIPTGGGKSLLYQMMALELKGITIVISPLIALMNEQVGELNNRGIKAIALNSDYTLIEQRDILRNLRSSCYRLIYISPERLQNPFFRAALIASGVPASMVVVDEAHCISQWGSGFRPDYSQIPGFINFLEENSQSPFVLCLTATLALNARTEIAGAFKVKPENIYVSPSILRTNLNLMFRKVDIEDEKSEYLRAFLEEYRPNKTIAYLYSKPLTKKYAQEFKNDFTTGFYNAGVDPDDRNETYLDFVNGNIEVLFATTAFGMGINIPDIESIVHIHIPNSIEEYYQQAGRGWRRRDPIKTCNCLALWSEKNFRERKRDLLKQKYAVNDIYEAYTTLTGSAEITEVGQVVNKSKDTLLNGSDYNLQLLKYKLEKYGIIRTLGELNGTPLTIQMHKNTLLWNRIQKIAEEWMDSFRFVSDELKIPLQEIIDHLYEQDLKNNIRTLPAMKKDVFFEILQVTISQDIAGKITQEINNDIDYRAKQLDVLRELFEGKDIQSILNNNLN